MSTTFGIKTKSGEITSIAFRYNTGNGKSEIKFTNPIAEELPDSTPVIAIDNSAQGIYTIGDIRSTQNKSDSTEPKHEERDLYSELRALGSMTSDQCCEVLDWTEKLPIQIIGLSNVKVTIVQGVIRVEPNIKND